MSIEETTDDRKRRFGLPAKLGLTGGVALLAVGALSYGVFANFTDTQSAGPQAIATGQVHIVLGTPAGDHGSIATGPLHNLAEGDNVYRVVELSNTTSIGASGTTGLAATNGLDLQATLGGANAASDIVTDATNGLHVTVQACATAPTETGGATGPWTYTCGGGFTSVVTNVPLKTLAATQQDITSKAPNQGSSTYFVVDLTLPTTYADAYSYGGGACSTAGTPGVSEQLMNCSLTVTYNFTATQRTGTNQ